MRRPESDFPAIKHLRDRLTDLIENGLGDLPVQILVVPNSTNKPTLMIELEIVEGSRLPVSMISTEQMRGRGIPTATH
jgi:hypothetical protein